MAPSNRGGPLLHPLHAILLAFPVALFTGALATDIAYLETAEMQWSNFSAWGIAVALLFGGPVALWAIVAFVRRRAGPSHGPALAYLLLVLAMWALGLINAFQHSHDAWSSVGTVGLMLSIATTLLALAAAWIGHASGRTGGMA